MRAVRTTSLSTNFNGSHLNLLPSSIHGMTGWVAIYCILWRMRTAPIHGVITSGEVEVRSPHTRPTTEDDYSAPGLWEKAHLNRLDFPFWNIRRIITRRASTNSHTHQVLHYTQLKVYVFSFAKSQWHLRKAEWTIAKTQVSINHIILISKYRGIESSETKNIVVTVLVPFAVPTNWKFPWTSEWHRTT